jgi:nicotinamidase/pyrazinamidase
MDVDYDDTTALVVVDVQNDFADPDGSLYVAGGDDIVAVVNRHVAAARDGGALVVYTQDWHPPVTPHFDTQGGVWPVHCVKDTWGAALHPDLYVADDAAVVRKGTDGADGYSGFTVRDPDTGEEAPTDLDATLRDHGIGRVVVCGLAQDVCVSATVLDALARDYATVVPVDATRPVDLEPGDGQRALAEMEAAGARLA